MLALVRRLLGHITGAGRGLLLIVVVGWLIVEFTGVDEVRLVVAMALVCLGIALVLTLVPNRVRAELEVRPQRTSVGQHSVGLLTVTNPGRLPMWSPMVDLAVPNNVASGVASDVAGGSAAAERRTLRLPVLRRGQPHIEQFELPAVRRGVHRLGPVTSRNLDPLGLIRRDAVWTGEVDWYVRPRVVPVESFGMGAVADLEGVPSDQISMSDLSFHALREYVRGDDLRHVHWRSSAKADTLLVRQYHDSRRSHAAVLVDQSAGAYASGEDFELALSAAASVVIRAAAEDFDLTFVCGDLEVDRRSSEEVLDACCRVDTGVGELRDAAVQAARLAPETSLLLVCTGGRRTDAEVRSAVAIFGNDVRRVVVRAETGAATSLRTVDDVALTVLGRLEHLPPLITKLGASRS